MPVLANQRHETFSQLAAKGIDGTHAYLTVYPNSKPDSARANAARLLATDSVAQRVSELSGKAAERAVVTAQMILERAWEVANSDAKDRAQHLAIAARAFPEFKDGVTVDNRTVNLTVEGLSVEELRQIARG